MGFIVVIDRDVTALNGLARHIANQLFANIVLLFAHAHVGENIFGISDGDGIGVDIFADDPANSHQ